MPEADFAGRIVIITGATGGVGSLVTKRWLDAGASVLAVGGAQHHLNSASAGWMQNIEPDRLATFEADVTTAAGADNTVAHAEQIFGKPADTLIHLVGGFNMGPLGAPDAPAVWDSMMEINLNSSFHCYRAMLPALRARGGGWIVGLASRAAITPPARMAAYAASKAGLIVLTQSLSAEVRAENIHVNVMLASTIDTPANRQSMGDDAAKDWVRPDDITDATFYLCLERARAVHGATLEIYANA